MGDSGTSIENDHELATFGDRVAAARKTRDISQAALAAKLGVTARTVAAWEAGQARPRPNKTQMLAAILNVSLRWLLSGTGDDAAVSAPANSLTGAEAVDAILAEMRLLKTELTSSAEKLSRLEKRLQDAL